MAKSAAVEAVYLTPELPEYQGNPMVEALPPILARTDIVRRLTNYPAYNESERTASNELREHMLDRLFDLFQPLSIHVNVASDILRLVRNGYKARNPLSTALRQMQYHIATAGQSGLPRPTRYAPTSGGLYIPGISGGGKTTLLRATMSLLPEQLVHTNYKGTPLVCRQVPILMVSCPHDASIKGFCLAFFSALDRILGTSYAEEHGSQRLSKESMILAMSSLALTHNVGAVFIDELQHLSQAKAGGAQQMMNFFLNLVNEVGVPIVFVGTYSSIDVFLKSLRNARRGVQYGSHSLDRFASEDNQWKFFVETLWRYQWTRKATPLDEPIIIALHDLSQGITDIVVKLYYAAQLRAIRTGKESLSVEDLQQTMETSLSLLQPALHALRKGGAKAIEAYEDLVPPSESVLEQIRRIEAPDAFAAFSELRDHPTDATPDEVAAPRDVVAGTVDTLVEVLTPSEIAAVCANDPLDLRALKSPDDAYAELREKGLVVGDLLAL